MTNTRMHQCNDRVWQLEVTYDSDAECYVSMEPCPECENRYITFEQ